MKIKKVIALALSAVILMTSCSSLKNPLGADDGEDKDKLNISENFIAGNAEAEKYPIEAPAITKSDFSTTTEAENAVLTGDLYISEEREGYSGEGYVSGFTHKYENSIKIPIDIPVSQHYDITLCIASDDEVKNSLIINEKKIGEFNIKENEKNKFIKAIFYNVFLEQGVSEISIKEIDGDFDFDYIQIADSENSSMNSNQVSSAPCNEKATENTKKLMAYMAENYGKKVITGQYASNDKNDELDLIYKATEQYPAIRFGDMRGYSLNGHFDSKEIEASEAWAEKGGIVGLMWYWSAPTGRASVYAASSDFDLSKAVTNIDIATLSQEQISNLYDEGKISKECLALIKDIDAVSEQLKVLDDKDIPVLWRPLHEAGGEWFWWGSAGPEAYQWLWGILYSRMTFYHDLNNLIWVWNGQDKDYMVSPNMYDIASMDIYLSDETDFGSRSEQYLWLKKLTNSKKMVAISECGLIPNIDNIFRDNAVWSFFGLWYGEYLMSQNGELSEAYNSAEKLKRVYNSEGSINLYDYINRDKGEETGESTVKETEDTDNTSSIVSTLP